MPAIVRASPFYIGTNEFFVYSVIAVWKIILLKYGHSI